MKLIKHLEILALLLLITNLVNATIPARKGWWKFDDASNLTKAETGYGNFLGLFGIQNSTAGPASGNGAVLIGQGSYYRMNHLISPNGGGTKVNEYSLQYDFKIPQNGLWHSFLQITAGNSDDGDLFINPSGNIGVGAVGYSSYSVVPNEWYRLIVSVKNGNEFTCYLDGKQIVEGVIQPVDGRFSLNSQILIFADNNGEDGIIYCSELSIWDQALTAQQASELGGYNHETYVEPYQVTRIPYLQSPGINSINICWHDTAQTGTKVEYGTGSDFGMATTGTSELISSSYRWHTVKLSGLQANTRYFYKVMSGTGESGVFSFKTLPNLTDKGKIRFILLSDTHCPDTTMAGNVVRAARYKAMELYGSDIENHVNGIFHSGDIVVSGSVPEQYSTEYFKPLSSLTPYIPTMVVAGNHEGESSYFYNYLKMDELSAFPENPALNEKIWSLRVANSLFIGLNTNITAQCGTVMADWLDTKLSETENNPDIDFVFLFFHHPPFTELWKTINNSDGGTVYVKNTLFPIIKKYSKVQEMHYGHTHGFERGTILSDKADGDFRIVCGGGGGGALDPWAEGANEDFNDIHVTISNYCYQILEIDPANHSYENTMYSLGSPTDYENNVPLDKWYKKKNQSGPAIPMIETNKISGENTEFNISKFSGVDSLMSLQFQVTKNLMVIKDSIINWENIYGVDQYNKPLDLNHGMNMNQIKIPLSLLSPGGTYYLRVRYRDFNLKWSNWSDSFLINSTEIKKIYYENNESLFQNYPNPFKNNTTINYYIPEDSDVNFRIYDINYRLIDNISEGFKLKGFHSHEYKTNQIGYGMYFYELITKNFCVANKMIKIQ